MWPKIKIDIPHLGWHPDMTLLYHIGRDAGFSLSAGLICWPFVLYAQGLLGFEYPIHWLCGAIFGYVFSCGWEAREKYPSFFGIGDFAVAIPASQIVLNVTLWLSGAFDWIVFGAVLGAQVLIYLIIIGGLWFVNVVILKRDIITP